ncbi:MAG: SDR family NAD(P)-dependent oxidoreductase [Litoreibacter sp.]|nr:SDR family NAD(P)-dependent oxidoreductase [Alphaproteobacteria bacterium]NNK79536.1 SDR family NAD(P)-dependent oxidoreductase [Litoreibacter sp.]
MSKPITVIVGVGDGLSASCARAFAAEGHDLVLAARDTGKLGALAEGTGARLMQCNGADPASVAALFDAIDGEIRVAIYNPSRRVRGGVADLDPEEVREAVEITAFGAFLTGQQAARRMQAQDPVNGVKGTILFTGASAGIKGFPQSATFAMGKFAQRGLAQAMARELHPQGIHVAWVNIDGAIRNPGRTEPAESPDSMLDPDAIARSYVQIAQQDRSAWSDEITLRPWVERF